MPRASTRASLPRGQAAINAFTRATKPGIVAPKTLSDGSSDGKQSSAATLPVSPSKKRKLNELENVDCGRAPAASTAEESDPTSATTSPGKGSSLTRSKSIRLSEASTPRSGHYASAPSTTPVRAARAAAENSASGSPAKRASVRRNNTVKLPEPVLEVRPPCVSELLHLHAAFVKALTMHAAHCGPGAPADLREFLHSVERLWKKRKVVVGDLQRLVWIWEQQQQQQQQKEQQTATLSVPRFRLANYGLGKVCLERVSKGEGRVDLINENELQVQFEQAVESLWENALDAAGGDESRVDFMATLGLSTIHESLTPFTTFRKGQQRLQDLRGGVIKLKTEKMRTMESQETQGPVKTQQATTSRRMGLLDRIKEKALRQSKLPPPPSKEMIMRGAAAQRTEEVAGVLSLLRPAGYVGSGLKAVGAAQRKPFQMAMIVQNVQDSVRNPISEKEVEVCLEILSRPDIAGQWVNIVTVNHIKSVVLKSCSDVNPKEIGAKVSQLKIGPEETVPVTIKA
ncbi:hypothetical protein P170DRAFT_434779 [Aspergillus steynii IBT 23096]|uniref:DNA replication factor Cdt1 C-terminal domain-containing protein n=1 Tax=Aspergillus steynii IBT 23096 TaxID=1392250 RepID=A0A2I2GJK8_9EURO|nr:uncharacterized protein P170DRAFT_434779 [Aspergillus steynii IBT 23096]PLB53054.1 hypothetical protein P170DRAFT_434779 [Aspergillus steynii IBT 23096]